MAGPLQEQIVGINFTKGLETLEDERIVQPGKMIVLRDAVLDENRTITPRAGWTNAVTGLTALNGLATFNNELLATNGQTLYSIGANDVAYSRATVPNVLTLSKEQVYNSTYSQDQFDCAVADPISSNTRYVCYAWRDTSGLGTVSGLYVTVRDDVTGAVLLAPFKIITSSTAECPRVVAQGTGTAFYVFYGDAPNLYCRVIDTTALGTVGAQTTLRTDYVAGGFDACAFTGNSSHALVVYNTSDATDSIYAIGVTRSGTTPSVGDGPTVITTNAQVSVISGIACAEFTTQSAAGIYILSSASGLWGAVLSSAYAVTGAAAVKDGASLPAAGHSTVTAAYDNTALVMHVYYDHLANWGSNGVIRPIRRSLINSSNTVTTGPATWANSATYSDGTNGGAPNGPFIAGKAFGKTSGSATTVYLPVFIGGLSKLQNTWFLLDGSARPVARALTGAYGFKWGATFATPPPFVGVPSSPSANSITTICPVGEMTLLAFDTAGTVISPVGLTRLSLTFSGASGELVASPHLRAQLGENLFTSGGALTIYDGLNATEAGFHEYPEGIKVVTGAAGNVTAGVHQVCALWEWIDGSGQRHQSAPSTGVSYTAPGGAAATVTIPTLQLTTKDIPYDPYVVVFATVAAGTTFHRLNNISNPVYNNKNVAMQTYSYNVSDANLIAGEQLYTNGGALPATAPPVANALCIHQNRVVAAPTENPNEFAYSQTFVPGFGIQWSDTLTGTVDASGGGLVGPASMDGKLFLFAARKIFCVFGNGPNAMGLQNGYSTPQEIQSDVGCSDARSILSTPAGIIFKSSKGWYLLNRALQVQYIGSGVETFNSDTVKAAVMHPTKKRALFACSTAVLVYDYLGDQWSTFSNYSATDLAWWPGRSAMVHSTSGGVINVDSGAATDNGTAITTTIATAWLHLGESLHGFQRVWRLQLGGKYSGTSTLTVQAFFDGSTTPHTTGAIATSTLVNTGSADWDFRWKLPVQKCRRVRFVITNVSSSANVRFSSLTLSCGIKKGAAKLPAAQSI